MTTEEIKIALDAYLTAGTFESFKSAKFIFNSSHIENGEIKFDEYEVDKLEDLEFIRDTGFLQIMSDNKCEIIFFDNVKQLDLFY